MKDLKTIKDLREKTKEFMYDRNMTLEVASTFFDCSIGALSNFLNGKTSPHERTLYRIRKRIGKA